MTHPENALKYTSCASLMPRASPSTQVSKINYRISILRYWVSCVERHILSHLFP